MLSTLVKVKIKGLFYRQIKSSKKKNSGIGKILLMTVVFGYVGVVFCYMFASLFSMIIEPLHAMGIDWLYFGIMALCIIMICFIGSVFIVEHEIYEAKDNDMLLAMPIKPINILLSRILMVLVLNYVYEILIVGPAFYVYQMNIGFNIIQILMFIIVVLTLPLFVIALSSIMAGIVAQILRKVRFNNFITLILWVGFMFLYMTGVNSIEKYIASLIANGQTIAQAIESSVPPLYHLAIALQDGNIISLCIYLVSIIVPFGIVMYVLSKTFVKIAISSTRVKKKEYVSTTHKSSSVMTSLLKRELKHFTSSAMVMLNSGMGILMSIMGTGVLIYYSKEIGMLLVIPEIQPYLMPILCLFAMSLGTLNLMTAACISLEGNRFWILKTLPINEKILLDSKILLQLLLSLPGQLLFALVGSIILKLSIIDAVIVIVVSVLFSIFVALIGILFNLWKPKFDWVNETMCVKQSMPVVLTMFLSMAIVAALVMVYGIVFFELFEITTYIYIITILFIIINIGLYSMVQSWGIKRFREL